jgi:hypothetical protein
MHRRLTSRLLGRNTGVWMKGHEDQKYPISFNSIQDKYWLYRWIDDQGVESVNDFYKASRKRNLIDVLSEYSALTTLSNSVPPRAVIPSTKLDLSGHLTCYHADCLIGQV